MDVLKFSRTGPLVPGKSWVWRWTRNGEEAGSIGAEVVEHGPGVAVKLVYAVNGEPCSCLVTIDRTPCHFGGSRPWFRCSGMGCGRRCRHLQLAGLNFVCRQCGRFTYAIRRFHRNLEWEMHRADGRLPSLFAKLRRARTSRRRRALERMIAYALAAGCRFGERAMNLIRMLCK